MSRYKFDRSSEFIPGYKVGGGHWRSVAIQTVSEPEIYQDAGFKLRADARVRVQWPLRICLGRSSKSKKYDKQLTFIVRVIVRCYCQVLIVLGFTFPSPIRVPMVRTGKGTYPSMSGKSYINGTDKLK